MYDILRQVEEVLPKLLLLKDWNSTHITYEPPEVRRLWRQCGKYRIFLHEIHPVSEETEVLYHPHRWKSIIKILKLEGGKYQMAVGFGPGLAPPPLAMKLELAEGSIYEMPHIDGWHGVKPTGLSYSLMITGELWERSMPKSDHPPQLPLAPLLAKQLQAKFQGFYPGA